MMTSPFVEGFVNTVQSRFFYVEAGRGPGVLFLHGADATHRDWSGLMPLVAERFRAIAPDLPGAGQSAAPREGYVRATIGRALIELLKGLGEERTAVVAHGLGAFLAIELAAAAPYMVERLVLLSPTVGGLEGSERQLSTDEALGESMLYSDGGSHDERIERIAAYLIRSDEGRRRYIELRKTDEKVDRRGVEATLSLTGSSRDGILLQTFKSPTLIVRPAHDPTFSRQRGQRMAQLIPDARLVELPDSGHLVHVEDPALVASVVLPFLQER